MSVRLASALIVLVVLLSGCTAGGGLQGPVVEAAYDGNTGSVAGVVTDESLVPLPYVTVRLDENAETTTDAGGSFAFSFVTPMGHRLFFELPGYETVTKDVDVSEAQRSQVTVRLVALATVEPYYATLIDDGRILCAADTRPGGFALNFCGALGLLSPVPTGDDSLGVFVVSGDPTQLHGLVFETSWITNQVTGRGLGVFWEVYQHITDPTTFPEGDPQRFARVEGVSPLRAMANQTLIQEFVHADPARLYCGLESCTVMARTFPRAATLGTSSPGDAAFYIDQRFTHYVTEFYRLAPADDFSALSDA